MVFRVVFFGNGLWINISKKKSSFITFRAKWSTRFIIPDNNRRKGRYRNFSLCSKCLLLLHLSYVLPQNDAIFDNVPGYKELKKKTSRTRTRTRCPLYNNTMPSLQEHDALSTRTQCSLYKNTMPSTITRCPLYNNTMPSLQEQSQNSLTSAKNRAKYLRGGHCHRLGNFSTTSVMRVSLMDLYRRFLLQDVTMHSTNALTGTRARLSFSRYQNWRHNQFLCYSE
jgi:hypothetical protein